MTDDKADKGLAMLRKLFGENVTAPDFPEDLKRYTVEHLFGDVWQGAGLTTEERSLLTCTVLVALGREAEQRIHFRGARNLGIPRGKIEAMLAHVAHYAGWPVAVSANRALDEVWPAK